ncbi:hypothetical protein [Dubosiella newyorkensis]|uniref:hypothetical protein n=1 Tax=Dubosiella newyorkensis TaxID=1862672 RepID=UPI003F66A80A
MYADAVKYNQLLLEERIALSSEEMHELYEKTLNVNDEWIDGIGQYPKAKHQSAYFSWNR